MAKVIRTPPQPPWYRDGRPDLWVTASKFALLVNRTRPTVYAWSKNGTLREFGYTTYRDLKGMLFIRIQEHDLLALMKINKNRKIKSKR
jgi:hypothetical protein